jgi:acetyl esterase/lipase
VTDIPFWGPAEGPVVFEVEKFSSIRYYDGPDADPRRHQLDVFVPKGKVDCPIVVLVHGGAWIIGDNRTCGLYSSVGEFLASRGVVTVLPNYRLSPEVKHPAHMQDLAHAVAWVHAHAADYGGRGDQMFLMGHSAGGHLVTLLATDDKYLREVGLATTDIQGVVAVSGVYRIAPGGMEVMLGGETQQSFGLDKMFPLRNPCTPGRFHMPGVSLNLDPFKFAFGRDVKVREDASPINHIRPGLPPFLIFHADNDLPSLPELAEEFHQALLAQGCDSQLLVIPERNHNSIIFEAYQASDPVARAVLDFIRQHIPSAATQDSQTGR